MAKKDLTGKKIAILVDEGFEQVEPAPLLQRGREQSEGLSAVVHVLL